MRDEKIITIQKSEYPYYKKYGICMVEEDYVGGPKQIILPPLRIADTPSEAFKKLKELTKEMNGEFRIIRFFESATSITKEKPKPDKNANKFFAVFTIPRDGSNNKVYYWGVVRAVDRNDGFNRLRQGNSLWYVELSKDVLLYELKEGKLMANHFPGIPVIDGSEAGSEEGLRIRTGVMLKPLEDILPDERDNIGTGDPGSEGRVQKGTEETGSMEEEAVH